MSSVYHAIKVTVSVCYQLQSTGLYTCRMYTPFSFYSIKIKTHQATKPLIMLYKV